MIDVKFKLFQFFFHKSILFNRLLNLILSKYFFYMIGDHCCCIANGVRISKIVLTYIANLWNLPSTMYLERY
jgi:hypothetical protein